jgi:putative ABC transport system permease protein
VILHLLKLVWNRKRANALIVAEMFFSFLVVFGVLVAAIDLWQAWRQPLGFQWKDVLYVRVEMEERRVREPGDETHQQLMRVLDEVRAMPEVVGAALTMTPPYTFAVAESGTRIGGRDVSFLFDDVTDDFANAMQLKVVKGRWFSAEDDAASDHPIVIDTNAAKEFFGDKDPIGQKLDETPRALRVVGVIEPYRKDGETTAPSRMMFRRYSPQGTYGMLGGNIVVRVRPGTPGAFEESLLRRMQQAAPPLGFVVNPMSQLRERMLRMRTAPLLILGTVGAFLIAMVALGLTGVLWQNVTRRTRELGLRRALGATGSSVHRQVLAEIVLLATFALLAGLVVVLQFPVLGVFTYVTKSAFTTGIVSALAAIYALTVVCGLYPSWLASRLEPADALRYE